MCRKGYTKKAMKRKDELQPLIDKIASADSPVGMDAVYVHALIIDKLNNIESRLRVLEESRTEEDKAK